MVEISHSHCNTSPQIDAILNECEAGIADETASLARVKAISDANGGLPLILYEGGPGLVEMSAISNGRK